MTFKVAILQARSENANISKNVDIIHHAMKKASINNADILLLPECFITGYDLPMTYEKSISDDNEVIQNICALAKEYHMGVVLTSFTKGERKPQNTAFVISNQGNILMKYSKVHTCDFADEKEVEEGKEFKVCNFDGVKIGIMICYDREYPESARILILELKKEHIENLIDLARGVKKSGVKDMTDFNAFDTAKIDDYIAKAREYWGDTAAFKEFEEKNADRTSEENAGINTELMKIFAQFGGMKDMDPASPKVQKQVKKLQDYITDKFYKCTNTILSSLGHAYSAEGEMNRNIDKAGGKGTGEFVDKAIQIYCSK